MIPADKAESRQSRNTVVVSGFAQYLVEHLSGRAKAVSRAWPGVELGDDVVHYARSVERQIAALGQVLTQQAVDASMSSRLLAPGDLVCPSLLVGEHRPMDDVDRCR